MSAPLTHRDITHAFFALNAELTANEQLLGRFRARGEPDPELAAMVDEQRERVSRFERAMTECDFHQVPSL